MKVDIQSKVVALCQVQAIKLVSFPIDDFCVYLRIFRYA